MHVNFNSLGLGLCGGNRCIFELSNCLIDMGEKVTITHLGDPSIYAWFSPVKAEVINVPDTRYSVPDRAVRKYLGKYLEKYGYGELTDRERRLMTAIPNCDVNVATHSFTAYSTYYSDKGRGAYLVQHYEPLFYTDPEIIKRVEKTYTFQLKKLCVSEWLAEKVGGVNIGNGINLDKFKPQKADKKYDVMLIQRFERLKGDYTPVLDALSKMGLKPFIVNKKLSEEELLDAYQSSRVFLFLSEIEGFGYPPLEAMACGLPVITTPCVEYVSHLDNAYLLKKDFTTNEVVSAINTLLSDEEVYASLVKGGFQTAKRFNIRDVAENFMRALQVKDD